MLQRAWLMCHSCNKSHGSVETCRSAVCPQEGVLSFNIFPLSNVTAGNSVFLPHFLPAASTRRGKCCSAHATLPLGVEVKQSGRPQEWGCCILCCEAGQGGSLRLSCPPPPAGLLSAPQAPENTPRRSSPATGSSAAASPRCARSVPHQGKSVACN